MRLIVDSANIQKDDVVLEVGSGTGSMTEALAEKAGSLIAVELDKNLSEIAAMQLATSENVKIINTDILESKNTLSQTVTKALDLAGKKCPGRILLVANKTIRTLKPAVFWPQPQVDSAMVCFIRNRAKSDRIKNMDLFSEIVHLFMGHRRKTLISCSKLAHGKLAKITNWPEIFEQCSICPTKRPETLDPGDYIAIANYAGYSLFLY